MSVCLDDSISLEDVGGTSTYHGHLPLSEGHAVYNEDHWWQTRASCGGSGARAGLAEMLRPCMQVITAILAHFTRGMPPLTMHAAAKVPGKYWSPGGRVRRKYRRRKRKLELVFPESGEGHMVVHKGELVQGILDKAVFGKFGLVHCVQARPAASLSDSLSGLPDCASISGQAHAHGSEHSSCSPLCGSIAGVRDWGTLASRCVISDDPQ